MQTWLVCFLQSNKTLEEFPHLLNQITYDSLGRMMRKDIGRLPNKTRMENPNIVFAETQTLNYNIRGWWNESKAYNKLDITNINSLGRVTAATPNFEHSLRYNFNGNIKESIWEGNGGQNYSYDGLNRLVSAIGKVNSPTKFEETISYDRNGNIETLLRKNAGGFTIDDLKYNYKANNPNQLDNVNDVASTTKKEEGFPARMGLANDFTYDANGNLLNDVARGISTTYNLLNLVNTVSFFGKSGNQSYTYAADGTKLSFTPLNGIDKTYIGAVEYNTGGTILRIGTEEGHVMLRPLWNENSKDTKYVYYYTIKDHLGNVRMVLDDDANANIWQKTDYNAFGLDAKNDFPQGISTGKERNNHLYNDKESDPETTRLDYGARQYDNVLGRWFVVDRFSEKYSNLSGYQYGGNNPISNVDMNGDSVVVLTAPKGANGLGHMAILIQNKDGEWALWSKNGTHGRSGTVGPNDSDKGDDDGTVTYSTPSEFMKSTGNPVDENGDREYTEGYLIPTTETKDRKAEEGAKKVLKEDYHVIDSSCATLVQSALGKAGNQVGSKSFFDFYAKDLIPFNLGFSGNYNKLSPNIIYERIKKQNQGKIIK
jgi:RHS repeat-associated protein